MRSWKAEHWKVRRNFTALFEIIWCKRGVGEVFLYNEAFSLLANDIFFYHPNERHKMRSLSDDFEVYWATFNGPYAVSFFDGYGYPRKMHSMEKCPVELFEKIRHQISDPSPLVFRSMLALLCQLLAFAGGTDKTEKDPVQEALNLIRKNLDNPLLNVNFLAEELQLHRSTLVDLFKKSWGAFRDRRFGTVGELLRKHFYPAPICR
ncbi:MAG: AraC family ligand binding domain-containing protein [Lentisphaeria bacterium]|nr:MAG: AraC family ligand binding domain-containing protein [Lentisphaeria bacterium]